MRRASSAGYAAALTARKRYEHGGLSLEELRPCEAEALDGTRLAGCLKTYIPAPSGRFGMVFSFEYDPDRPMLAYLAFGVRHHPRDSHALTVYQIADRRLNG